MANRTELTSRPERRGRRGRFLALARASLQDAHKQRALRTAVRKFQASREQAYARFQVGGDFRDRARAIRAHTVAHLGHYLERLVDRVEARGGHVHWAEDASAAGRIVVDIARAHGVRRAVKTKSNTAEEAGVGEALAAAGIPCIETDLGERVLQLAKDPGIHLMVPTFHIPLSRVAELYGGALGQAVEAEVSALTAAARTEMRPHFLAAEMCVTGVNFAVAESGTCMVISNEGNEGLSTALPPVHVAIMGIDRVVPTWEDLLVMLRVLPRSCSGQEITVYATLFSGPRRSGELDGPDAFHLVLLDNGRSAQLGGELEESLYCIRCGACLNVCPVYGKAGSPAYGLPYSGPIGAVVMPYLFPAEADPDLPHASSLCGACEEACPVRIDLPRMLVHLRARQVEDGRRPALERLVFRALGAMAADPRRYLQLGRAARWLVRLFARQGGASALSRMAAGATIRPAARPFRVRWADLEQRGGRA